MRFNQAELASIEHTINKLANITNTLQSSEQTDAVNVRYLTHIISEMRLCAGLLNSDDRNTRVSAYDRLDDLITK